MIRSLKFPLLHANKAKLQDLHNVMVEYNRIVNVFITELYCLPKLERYPKLKTPTWLSANLQRQALLQALAIVKRARDAERQQRYRKYKKLYAKAKRECQWHKAFLATRFKDLKLRYRNIPTFNSLTMELSSHEFVDYSNETDYFSEFAKLKCLVSMDAKRQGITRHIKLPTHHYSKYNRYLKAGWSVKRSLRLERCEGKHPVLVKYLEKETPAVHAQPLKALGFDLGINKLITDSEGNKYGTEFKSLLDALSRKEQGSKSYNRQLTTIYNYISRCVNELVSHSIDKGYTALVGEMLKYLTIGTRKRALNKRTRKLLSHWNLGLLWRRLRDHCEVQGLHFARVSPSYTSQTCPRCQHRDKGNRNGEKFFCVKCNYTDDADKVGAVNVLARFLAESHESDDTDPLSVKLNKRRKYV